MIGMRRRAGRPRLYVFALSHFAERARWGLDACGVAYEEVRWAPGPHVIRARRLGLRTTSVPILETGGGGFVQGSGSILDALPLDAGDRALEARFETRIGPLVRRLMYAATLRDPRSGVLDAMLSDASPLDEALMRAAFAIGRLVARRAAPDEALVASLIAELDEELDWFGAEAERRGPYLVGESFGRADLTAASLLAPLAMPASCPVSPLYRSVRLPAILRDALDRWRGGRALSRVGRLYDGHRAGRPFS